MDLPFRDRDGFPVELICRFVEQTPDTGVVLVGLDRRMLHWLGAGTSILGYTAEEAKGQLVDILFTEEDRQRGIPQLEIDEALRSPRSEDDRWHVRKDGSRVFLSGSAVVVRDDAGAPVCIAKTFRDHTDRRAYVETLEHRIDGRDRARAFKEVSVAALAHELRNPLGPLRHAMQMLRMACTDPAVEHPLAIIDRQMASLQRLVDDLVDAGRVATGKLSLDVRPVDLNRLIEATAEAMQTEFQEREIRFSVILPATPIVAEVDEQRIQQVLTNLLNNAARYTPRGGTVWIKSTVEANFAVIRVQDTGVGLSAETLPYIFNLFTRGPQAEALAPSGMGVGLSVVKQIVEQHNGFLDVRSEGLGRGTEFSVHLPFTPRRGLQGGGRPPEASAG